MGAPGEVRRVIAQGRHKIEGAESLKCNLLLISLDPLGRKIRAIRRALWTSRRLLWSNWRATLQCSFGFELPAQVGCPALDGNVPWIREPLRKPPKPNPHLRRSPRCRSSAVSTHLRHEPGAFDTAPMILHRKAVCQDRTPCFCG